MHQLMQIRNYPFPKRKNPVGRARAHLSWEAIRPTVTLMSPNFSRRAELLMHVATGRSIDGDGELVIDRDLGVHHLHTAGALGLG
jgi:hypothetical protein